MQCNTFQQQVPNHPTLLRMEADATLALAFPDCSASVKDRVRSMLAPGRECCCNVGGHDHDVVHDLRTGEVGTRALGHAYTIAQVYIWNAQV